jgi:hypothetical protein
MRKKLILTFDTEEFDLPEEFGFKLTNEEKFELSRFATQKVLSMLKKYDLKATFFVTGSFAFKFSSLIKEISLKHEIALHGAVHNHNYHKMDDSKTFKELTVAKKNVEKIINKPVFGFRAPRFQRPSLSLLRKVGFKYDSSLHPTYVPGRYNNFFKPRTKFYRKNLIIFPISVSPMLRMPFSFLWFRNLPLIYSYFNSWLCQLFDGYVHLYFHPWEFVNLSKWQGKISTILIRNCGKIMLSKSMKYLELCKRKNCKSMTITEFLKL